MQTYLSAIKKFLTQNTSSKQTVIKNTFWLLLAEGISKGSVFVMMFVIAKYLGPQQFGSFSYIISFVALFSVIVDYGLTNLVVRELSKDLSKTNEYLVNGTLLKFVLGIVNVGVVYIAMLAMGIENVSMYLVLLYCIYSIINSIGEFIRAFFRPNEHMQHEAVLKIINGVLFFAVVGYSTIFVGGLDSIIRGFLTSGVINLFLSLLYVFIYFRFKSSHHGVNTALIVQLLKKGAIMALGLFFVNMYINFDQFLLGYYNFDYDLGIYSLGYKMTFIYTIIFAMFFQTLLPRVTKNPSKETYWKGLRWTTYINIILVLLYGGVTLFLYYQPYRDLGEYRQSLIVFLCLMLYCVFESYGHRGYINLLALGRDRDILKIFMLCALCNVLLNLIVIPRFSYQGAIVVNILTYLVYYCYVHYKLMSITRSGKNII